MRPQQLLAIASAMASLGAEAQIRGPVTLNDTGLTQCVAPDGTSITTQCKNSGQDAAYGRDVAFPSDKTGHAGFDFVKIGFDGGRLPVEASSWHCVLDRVTGLVWDVSTHGVDHHGWGFTHDGSGSLRDADRLAEEANSRALCGATNWRLPTIEEMQGILDDSVPAGTGPFLDTRFFKNARATWYWTSTVYAPDPNAWWNIDFGYIEGGDGAARNDFKLAVRLVHDDGRAPADPTTRYTFIDDEVWDTWTRLVWKRCAIGQSFDGKTCKGSPELGEWMQAISRSQEEAERTGLGWRLPNPKELSTIMDRTLATSPAMDQTVFPGSTPNSPPYAYYWTATMLAGNPSLAWTLDIRGGYTQSYPTTTKPIAARLVRDMPK